MGSKPLIASESLYFHPYLIPHTLERPTPTLNPIWTHPGHICIHICILRAPSPTAPTHPLASAQDAMCAVLPRATRAYRVRRLRAHSVSRIERISASAAGFCMRSADGHCTQGEASRHSRWKNIQGRREGRRPPFCARHSAQTCTGLGYDRWNVR